MLGQIDKACNDAGVWPHEVLSAHAHNCLELPRGHQRQCGDNKAREEQRDKNPGGVERFIHGLGT